MAALEMKPHSNALPLHAQVILRFRLSRHIQRMAAARVRPIARKCNLLVGPLLEKQLVFGVKQEYAKCAMTHQRAVLFIDQVTYHQTK